MLIRRDEIATMIPHAGAMVLLDEVLGWDTKSIRALSRRYAATDNPLRHADGTLGTACGIEIAAQTMAIHARLVAPTGTPPSLGYLASLRDVRFGAAQLDAATGDLIIEAARLMGNAGGATYNFTLTRGATLLLSGRATVLLMIGT